MANVIQRFIDIIVNSDNAVSNLNKTDNALKKVDDSATKVTHSTKNLTQSVVENGGAIGLLNELTGGLASTFKDASEAVGLAGISLKSFKGIMLATGIGALVVLVGELAANWDDVRGFIDGSTAALKRYNEESLRLKTFTEDQIRLNDLAAREAEAAGAAQSVVIALRIQAIKDEILLLREEETAQRNARSAATEGSDLFIAADKEIDRIQTRRKTILGELGVLEIQLTSTIKKEAEEQAKIRKAASDKQAAQDKKDAEARKKAREERIAHDLFIRESGIQGDLDASKFTERVLRDEDKKFEAAKLRIQQERLSNEEQLQLDRELFEKGDITRMQLEKAEERFFRKKQQLYFEDFILRTDNDERIEQQTLASLERMVDIDDEFFQIRLGALEGQNEIIRNSYLLTEDQKTLALQENAAERIRIETEEYEARKNVQLQYLGFLEQSVGIVSLFTDKSNDLKRATLIADGAIGIARVIISTQIANTAAIAKWNIAATAAGPAGPTVAAAGIAAETTRNWIGAGLSMAAITAATIKGLAAVGKGGGAPSGTTGGSGEGGGGGPAQFNIVGQSQTNQLAVALNSKDSVVKAQVVSTEVSTAQALDRNRVEQSVFI